MRPMNVVLLNITYGVIAAK